MLKKSTLAILLVFSIGLVKAQNGTSNSTDQSYFAQGNFQLSESQNLESLNDHISSNTNIQAFRFDVVNNLFIVFTKEIGTFDNAILMNWFGDYLTNVSCVQIGIQGVDERNEFPFQNCND